MVLVMPVIFMLTVIIDVWIKREMIETHLGKKSGNRGIAFSIVLGSLSAGPIYAAFPICKMLLSKGASVTNIVVILSSWAVIKVPMLANEARFLGPKFMALRWLFSVLVIYIIAKIMAFLVKEEDMLKKMPSAGSALIVTPSLCIGCGICEKKAPETFMMVKQKAFVKSPVTCNEKSNALITLCPVGAIQCTE